MNDIQRTVAKLLADRGMTLRDLAAAIGLSEVSVADQVQGNLHLHRRVRKIENYLGVAIWTSAERFAQLQRASAVLGTDAVLTGFHELRRRAIKLRVPRARKYTSKDDLVNAVLAHAPNQSTQNSLA